MARYTLKNNNGTFVIFDGWTNNIVTTSPIQIEKYAKMYANEYNKYKTLTHN